MPSPDVSTRRSPVATATETICVVPNSAMELLLEILFVEKDR